jgi:hypothetical protein
VLIALLKKETISSTQCIFYRMLCLMKKHPMQGINKKKKTTVSDGVPLR